MYLVGRKGGESFLRKRFHERHVDRALDVFRRHGILSVLVPSLMPPPMPFKIFVFSAGVFGVPFRRFVVTIALARGARYTTWAILGAAYGRGALSYLKAFDAWFDRYDAVILPLALVLLLVGLLVALRRRGTLDGSREF